MITSADMHRQVTAAVEGNGTDLARGIDIQAVVDDIHRQHGLIDVDTMDADEFWGIVANHDYGDDEDFRADGPTAEQERAWDEQYDGTSLGC